MSIFCSSKTLLSMVIGFQNIYFVKDWCWNHHKFCISKFKCLQNSIIYKQQNSSSIFKDKHIYNQHFQMCPPLSLNMKMSMLIEITIQWLVWLTRILISKTVGNTNSPTIKKIFKEVSALNALGNSFLISGNVAHAPILCCCNSSPRIRTR